MYLSLELFGILNCFDYFLILPGNELILVYIINPFRNPVKIHSFIAYFSLYCSVFDIGFSAVHI